MIDVEKTTKNIFFEKGEDRGMAKELELAFCELDKATGGYHYSGENIEHEYPNLWKLFRILRK